MNGTSDAYSTAPGAELTDEAQDLKDSPVMNKPHMWTTNSCVGPDGRPRLPDGGRSAWPGRKGESRTHPWEGLDATKLEAQRV